MQLKCYRRMGCKQKHFGMSVQRTRLCSRGADSSLYEKGPQRPTVIHCSKFRADSGPILSAIQRVAKTLFSIIQKQKKSKLRTGSGRVQLYSNEMAIGTGYGHYWEA